MITPVMMTTDEERELSEVVAASSPCNLYGNANERRLTRVGRRLFEVIAILRAELRAAQGAFLAKEQAEAQAAELRAADEAKSRMIGRLAGQVTVLKSFAHHLPECSVMRAHPPCSCGWDTARTQMEEA